MSKPKSKFPRWIIVLIALTAMFFARQWMGGGKTYYWYDGGIMQAEGVLKKGKEHGEWKYYYRNEQLQSIQHYENGVETGVWEWYYPNGQLEKKGNYANGEASGEWVFYYENGKLKSKGSYSTNEMEGRWEEFYESGGILSEGKYEAGKPVGKWNFYYESGNLEASGMMQGVEKTGVWTYYHRGGQEARKVDFTGDVPKILTAWTPSGEQTVTDGNGILVEYYDDGETKKSETRIEEGVKNGSFQAWYENGNLKETGRQENDVYYLASAWSRDGDLIVENGTGNYEYYHPNGVRGRTGRYANGLQEGEWKTWTEDGELYIVSNFSAGKMNGPFVQYHPGGQPAAKGQMQNDQKTGVWTWFWPNGQKQTEVEFKDGEKVGEQQFWGEDGSLQ